MGGGGGCVKGSFLARSLYVSWFLNRNVLLRKISDHLNLAEESKICLTVCPYVHIYNDKVCNISARGSF